MLNAASAPATRPSHFEVEYLREDEVLLSQQISAQLHLRNCLGAVPQMKWHDGMFRQGSALSSALIKLKRAESQDNCVTVGTPAMR